MDYNFNLNQNLTTTNGYNINSQGQDSPGTSMWIGNYPSIQQLQQINAQMGNLNLTDTGTNYLDAYMALSQNAVSPTTPTSPGPFYVASVQPTPVQNTVGFSNITAGSTSFIPGQLQVPLSTMNGAPLSPTIQSPVQQQPPLLTEEQLILLAKMQRDALAAVAAASSPNTQPPQVSSNTTQVVGTQTMPNPVSYEDFAFEQQTRGPKSRSSSHSESAPQTPKTPRTSNGNSLATTPESKRAANRSFSETNSTASSASIPGSPTSSGGIPPYSFSEENSRSPTVSSPTSPKIRILNEEPRSPTPGAIVSRSLSFKVKYPQDKCYKCMKKVYPMEKIGPIKEVVYHKGCFCCKACGTKLSLKNFFNNQAESYDINVYCKTHQPGSVGKGGQIDSESVLIKGALSVPKLDHVNEQIRGDDETHKGGKLDASSFGIKSALQAPKPEKYHCDQIKTTDNAYHYDIESVEIAHARNVPVADLQTSNKLKHSAWKKEDRDHESLPPPDVVKYSEIVPDYDVQAYEKYQVENYPDYDRR